MRSMNDVSTVGTPNVCQVMRTVCQHRYSATRLNRCRRPQKVAFYLLFPLLPAYHFDAVVEFMHCNFWNCGVVFAFRAFVFAFHAFVAILI